MKKLLDKSSSEKNNYLDNLKSSLNSIDLNKDHIDFLILNLKDKSSEICLKSLEILNELDIAKLKGLKIADFLYLLYNKNMQIVEQSLKFFMKMKILESNYLDKFIHKIKYLIVCGNMAVRNTSAKIIREIAAARPYLVKEVFLDIIPNISQNFDIADEIIFGFGLAYKKDSSFLDNNDFVKIIFALISEIKSDYSSINWSICYCLSLMFQKNPNFIRKVISQYIEHKNKDNKQHQDFLKNELRKIEITNRRNIQVSLLKLFGKITPNKKLTKLRQQQEEYGRDSDLKFSEDRREERLVDFSDLKLGIGGRDHKQADNLEDSNIVDDELEQAPHQEIIILNQIIDLFSEIDRSENKSDIDNLEKNNLDQNEIEDNNLNLSNEKENIAINQNESLDKTNIDESKNNNNLYLENTEYDRKNENFQIDKIDNHIQNEKEENISEVNDNDFYDTSVTKENQSDFENLKEDRIENNELLTDQNIDIDENYILNQQLSNFEITDNRQIDLEKNNQIYQTVTKDNVVYEKFENYVRNFSDMIKEGLDHRFDRQIDQFEKQFFEEYSKEFFENKQSLEDYRDEFEYIKGSNLDQLTNEVYNAFEKCPGYGLSKLFDLKDEIALNSYEQVDLVADAFSKIVTWDIREDNMDKIFSKVFGSAENLPFFENYISQKDNFDITNSDKSDLIKFLGKFVELYKDLFPEQQINVDFNVDLVKENLINMIEEGNYSGTSQFQVLDTLAKFRADLGVKFNESDLNLFKNELLSAFDVNSDNVEGEYIDNLIDLYQIIPQDIRSELDNISSDILTSINELLDNNPDNIADIS